MFVADLNVEPVEIYQPEDFETAEREADESVGHAYTDRINGVPFGFFKKSILPTNIGSFRS